MFSPDAVFTARPHRKRILRRPRRLRGAVPEPDLDRHEHTQDDLDESLRESFPASDPSGLGSARIGSPRRRLR
jgi:hypothetical protein